MSERGGQFASDREEYPERMGVPSEKGWGEGVKVLDLEETMNGKFSLITVRNTLRVVSWTHKFL